MDALSRLADLIHERRGADPASSYTAKLLDEGVEKCAKKLGEEAVEAALAGLKGDRDHLTMEAADVFYHLLVLLEATDVGLDDVMAELDKRSGTSGLVEKASRKVP
ncbi:phosphoribosyl-ATP diphosphatase [Kaustia mangrovi]|uniref:Phosphoribosyl-ATP pyrophosphatase n=1 Tax=Kaustia mangrovi TaxID=2593653 RepID=A0A7S8HDZ5_9HYPH|nr:phosphoribosyl-ATP diphosphatase [Kaustia mangrovi]QPC45312.1 phosphoribosyl-ATP diphosphatase [Kaustia mangrovi]